jgi:hypothetical protein
MKKLMIAAAFILLAGVIFGQTLQKGCVLAVHHLTITLQPDVTMDQYLDFLNNTFIPEFEKQFPGIKMFSSKGLNRENKDDCAVVFYSKSMRDFNKYWNDDGGSTDVGAAAMDNLQPIRDEMNKLGTFTDAITDWVIQ